MHLISNIVITCTILYTSHTPLSACGKDLTRYLKRGKKVFFFFFSPFTPEKFFLIQAILKH